MNGSNPIFNFHRFVQNQKIDLDQIMTTEGTLQKTAILLSLLVASSIFSWTIAGSVFSMAINFIAIISTLIAGVLMVFKPELSSKLAPAYAIGEGLLLGSISAFFNSQVPGLAITALSLTTSILAAMILIYKTRLITVTDNFRFGVISATLGFGFTLFLCYMFQLFGLKMPFFGNGPIGIIFSVFVICLAASNLLLDFDFIERGSSYRLPKYMEWYAAFGLMVTLVWLYIEVMKLLMKLSSRRSN